MLVLEEGIYKALELGKAAVLVGVCEELKLELQHEKRRNDKSRRMERAPGTARPILLNTSWSEQAMSAARQRRCTAEAPA